MLCLAKLYTWDMSCSVHHLIKQRTVVQGGMHSYLEGPLVWLQLFFVPFFFSSFCFPSFKLPHLASYMDTGNYAQTLILGKYFILMYILNFSCSVTFYTSSKHAPKLLMYSCVYLKAEGHYHYVMNSFVQNLQM